MQVRADQLATHLQKGLRPLYTVWGDEPLLAQEARPMRSVPRRVQPAAASARCTPSPGRISTGAACSVRRRR
jgi:DNA polymerase III subunit delta